MPTAILLPTFNASDFKVSGGRFVFHIPDEYADSLLTISFADLYSNYGDTTYYNGERNGNARYSFVTSEYFVKNENLYAPNGDVDDHTRKVIASTAGNIRFRFNNADILEHLSGTTSNNNTLQEYAFDLHTYVNGYEDPDGNTNSDGTIITGDTIPCLMKASDEAIRSRTFYVFTADETRFNIAPTTAWQHRGYAFYRMDIELQAVEYTPKLTWTKIYDEGKTFYEDANGQIQTKSMWGVKLNTEDSAGEFTGYLTVKEIIKAIDDEMDNTEITTPADKDQILYIDASDLYSIVNSVVIDPNTNVADTLNLSDLKQGLAPNAIIFLPSKATTKLDNFAYLSDGVFRAGNHIIITDKNPFYSPYDIQVDASNYAKYTRKVTKSSYGEVRYATVFMPFTIKFDEGTDAQAGVKTDSEFGQLKFLQMNTNNATADEYDYGTAFFSPSTGTQVDANTPYALQVVENKAGDSFTLRQFGSKIIATPDAAKNANNKSLFSAKELTSTGNLKDKNGSANKYTFSHMGSFSGFAFPKADPECFYFAKNGFYKSTDLIASKPNVELFPFRSVYKVTGSTPISFVKATFFNIKIGENDQSATGIQNINNKYSEISTGNGTITITAANDNSYKIFSTAGLNTHNISLKAGETRTVYVPAGIYMVNGVKVMVK